MDPRLLLLLLCLLLAVVLCALAFSGPSASRAVSRRLSDLQGRHGDGPRNLAEARMRREIANRPAERSDLFSSLIPKPELLAKRLQMTGKKWTLSQYLTVCFGISVAMFAFLQFRQFSLLVSLFLGFAVGFGLPHKVIGMMIAKRINKFTTQFPDALDLLVRGLRSGLPVSETLLVISREIPAPVGEEFRMITERIKIGKSMEQAMEATAERLGTAEFKFFCITLSIQRETGGNLAETLNNLSQVLRQRGQMKLKIKAMSSESKASAYIIGVLPFLVFGMICWINYGYMAPFFTGDPAGFLGLSGIQMVGIGGMCWMSIGAFIMAKMVNFEI